MSAPRTIPANTSLLLVGTSSFSKTFILPTISTNPGRLLIFKDIYGSFSTSSVFLSTTGLDGFENNGSSMILSTNYGAWTLMNDAMTKWFLIDSYKNTMLVSTFTPPASGGGGGGGTSAAKTTLISQSLFFLRFANQTFVDSSPNNVSFAPLNTSGGFVTSSYSASFPNSYNIQSQNNIYCLYQPATLATNVSSASFCCWIYHTSIPTNEYIGYLFSRGNATGISRASGSPNLGYHWNDDGNTYTYTGGPDVTPYLNTWLHIAFVVTPTAQYWYFNGSLVFTRTYTVSGTANFTNFYIGCDPCCSSSRVQPGYYKDVALFSRALTLAEVQALASTTS